MISRSAQDAAEAIREGKLVAYPTEGVWGLGCDPQNAEAIKRLLQIKQRPWQKGLILIASQWSQLRNWVDLAEPPAAAQAEWPGHLTCLLPAAAHVSELVRGEHPNIAVRISAHPPVRELCEAFGGAIISTSANRHGQATPATLQALQAEFAQEIEHYFDAPLGTAQSPSRIMDPYTGKYLRT